MPNVLLIAGPGGSGKTTIAKLIAKRYGYVYISGDEEDTEFFPASNQWLPENIEHLQKAHKKIFDITKKLFHQGKSVVIDYIIFGHYQTFLEMFIQEFSDQFHVKVLLPSQKEMIKRDKEREGWTTGVERISEVTKEYKLHEEFIGRENFIDTSGQPPEQTVDTYFSDLTPAVTQ